MSFALMRKVKTPTAVGVPLTLVAFKVIPVGMTPLARANVTAPVPEPDTRVKLTVGQTVLTVHVCEMGPVHTGAPAPKREDVMPMANVAVSVKRLSSKNFPPETYLLMQ